MPIDYSGDPSQTQAPASRPEPGLAPIVRMPLSGEPLVVAGVVQAWKVLADYVAWLMNPTAKAGSWGQAIRRRRNARLQTRSVTDHLGFPGGKFLGWQEDWADVGFTTKASIANGAWAKRWNYSIAGAVANTIGVVANGPGTPAFPRSPAAFLAAGTSGVTANSHHIEHVQPILFTADTDMTMQWDLAFVNGNVAITEFAMGLATTSQQGVATAFSAQLLDGAALVKRVSVANWDLYSKAPGAGHTWTTTGVTTMTRARLELRGANVSDDSTARALLYLDGASPINVAVDVSGAAAAGVFLYPFFRVTTTAVLSQLYVGAVDFRANTAIGDVTL